MKVPTESEDEKDSDDLKRITPMTLKKRTPMTLTKRRMMA